MSSKRAEEISKWRTASGSRRLPVVRGFRDIYCGTYCTEVALLQQQVLMVMVTVVVIPIRNQIAATNLAHCLICHVVLIQNINLSRARTIPIMNQLVKQGQNCHHHSLRQEDFEHVVPVDRSYHRERQQWPNVKVHHRLLWMKDLVVQWMFHYLKEVFLKNWDKDSRNAVTKFRG
jgi:hypothetical protein